LQKFAEVQKPIVCVHEVPREDVYRYGVVQIEDDHILKIVEQPKVEDAPSNFVCNGVYLLPKSIFPLIEKTPINVARNEYLLPDTLNMLMQQHDVRFLQVDPFRDIGSVDLRMKANNKMYQDGFLYPPK
jgi:UTP-glucose-1-phosphate uridylyltransferase